MANGDSADTRRRASNGARIRCNGQVEVRSLRDKTAVESNTEYVRSGELQRFDFGLYDVETTSVLHCSVWVTPG